MEPDPLVGRGSAGAPVPGSRAAPGVGANNAVSQDPELRIVTIFPLPLIAKLVTFMALSLFTSVDF